MEMKFPKCETKMKDCKYNPTVYSGDQCMFHIADGKNCIHRQHVADYKLSNYDAQAAKIAQLEKALELACEQVDKSGTAPCDEQCERGKGCIDCLINHYMQKAKEATND